MKKLILLSTIFICFFSNVKAQFSTFIRLTDYSNKVLTTNGALESVAIINGNNLDVNSGQFLKVSAFSNDIEQSLSITSTSTGAGAGKVVLNPISITKYMDAMSPTLMQNCASGTPYKMMEVFFVNAQNIIFAKQVYKLSAVKTVAWTTTCPSGCTSPLETVTFEHGGQIVIINRIGEGKSGTIQAGWNKVKNIPDSDPNTAIQ